MKANFGFMLGYNDHRTYTYLISIKVLIKKDLITSWFLGNWSIVAIYRLSFTLKANIDVN